MKRVINYAIDSASDGLRVEQFLKRRGYSCQNLTEIKRMPESILVNGIHYYMRQQLASGDILSVRICETGCSKKVPPVSLPLDIVYEDEDLIVINKPAGMPIHPSLNHYTNSLANGLAWYYQEQEKPFIFRCCNRLDRDTSGLTVVAKHLVSASILSNMVRRHQLHREYLAIVRGRSHHSAVLSMRLCPASPAPSLSGLWTLNMVRRQSPITESWARKTGTAWSPFVWKPAAPIKSESI